MRPTIGIDRLTSSRRIDHRAKSADDGSGGTFASDFETQPRRLVRLVLPIFSRQSAGKTRRTSNPPSLDRRTCVINRIFVAPLCSRKAEKATVDQIVTRKP
jgi:hypothetical protein